MKLLNYNELKTLLLEERDKIPLTVPGARYEMNVPQPNKHGQSMRGGIRIALRCMERCQPVMLDDLRPKGRWEIIEDDYLWDSEQEDEYYVVLECECSVCKERVRYDKPNFCPSCGADMRGGGEDA